MPFCIPPQINRKLKAAFDSGQISSERFLEMTSDERETFLEKTIGKQYKTEINSRFVKNFNTELSDEAIQDTIKSMGKINQLRATDKTPWIPGQSKEWAREYVALQNRLQDAVNPQGKMGASDTFKNIIKTEIKKISDQESTFGKVVQTGKLAGEILTSAVYKSLKASVDLSYALRQGFKVFTKSPEQWGKSMQDSFNIIKNIGNRKEMDAVMDEFKASFLSHPNYEKLINEGKLAFGVVEDFFPTTVTEKIPGLGNFFKASNEAFTIFSQSARFGLANDMLERQIQKVGRELTPEELKAIGTVANSITGRGGLGRLESISGALNKLFFSARYVKSQADTFIMPFNPKLTPFARQEALKSSLATLGTIAALMTTASFFGDVEFDPRSSKFGKLRIGNTKNYIDLTAGLGSYITLAAKQATGQVKSSTSGKISKLNTGKFGSQTRGDVLQQWATNKLAPAPATINEVILKGEQFGGGKPTPVSVARNLLAPISADNIYDYLTNEELGTALLLSGSDLLGTGVTTYK